MGSIFVVQGKKVEVANNADDSLVVCAILDCFAYWVFYTEFFDECLVDNDRFFFIGWKFFSRILGLRRVFMPSVFEQVVINPNVFQRVAPDFLYNLDSCPLRAVLLVRL